MSNTANADYSAYSSPQIASILQQRLLNPEQQPSQPSYQAQGSPRAPHQTPPNAMFNQPAMGPPPGMSTLPSHSFQGAPAQSMQNFPQTHPPQMYYNPQAAQNMQYSSAPVSPKYAPQAEIHGQGVHHGFVVQQQLSTGSMSPSRTPSSSVPPQPLAASPAPIDKPERAKSPGASSLALELSIPLKPPKAPEKPLIPYLRFSKSIWETAKSEHPGLAFADIGKVIGEKWKSVDPDSKQKFTEEYNRDKEKYAQAQKLYLESSEYHEYLAAKTKRDQLEEEAAKRREELAKAAAAASAAATANAASRPQSSHSGHSGGFMQPLHGPLEELQSMSQRMLPPKQPGGPSGGNQVQAVPVPADIDEDSDDYLKSKHVSATRYKRNHKLMAEVFSDSIVPDGRMVVNEQRMALLRKQVQSLTHHQERLLMEQKELTDKHEVKKRKLLEDTENFNRRWAQVKEECKPVSKEQYQGMLDKYQKILEKMYADHHAQTQKNFEQAESFPVAPAEQGPNLNPEDQMFVDNHTKYIDNIMAEPISSPPHGAVEFPSFQTEGAPHMDAVQASSFDMLAASSQQPAELPHPEPYGTSDERVAAAVNPAESMSALSTASSVEGHASVDVDSFPDPEVVIVPAPTESFAVEVQALASPPKPKSPTESPKNNALDVTRMPLKKRHSLTPYGEGSPSPPAPERSSPTEPVTGEPAQNASLAETLAVRGSPLTTAPVKTLESGVVQQEIDQQAPEESATDSSPPKPMGPARWFLSDKEKRPELEDLSDVSSDDEMPEEKTETAVRDEQRAEDPKQTDSEGPKGEKSGGSYADYAL